MHSVLVEDYLSPAALSNCVVSIRARPKTEDTVAFVLSLATNTQTCCLLMPRSYKSNINNEF